MIFWIFCGILVVLKVAYSINNKLNKMLSVYCKEVEPDLNLDHKIKGLDILDLKRNMRSHLRETHPETEIQDIEMYAIDSRIESQAEEDDVPEI